jgi:hypothetical protein
MIAPMEPPLAFHLTVLMSFSPVHVYSLCHSLYVPRHLRDRSTCHGLRHTFDERDVTQLGNPLPSHTVISYSVQVEVLVMSLLSLPHFGTR